YKFIYVNTQAEQLHSFADDTIFSFLALQRIILVTDMFNLYCEATDAQVNQGKTYITSSLPPTNQDLQIIQNSAWPLVAFKDSVTHLGIPLGRNLEIKDIIV